MNLGLPVPCYTTICRRAKELDIDLEMTHHLSQGEGEWHMKTHGKSKRRKWVKIHIALDLKTREVVVSQLTDSKTTDGSVLGELLSKVKRPIGKIDGDGAYDQKQCYEHVEEREGDAIFRIRKDAKLEYEKDGALKNTQRNRNLLEINKKGVKLWKKEALLHKLVVIFLSSLVEPVMVFQHKST